MRRIILSLLSLLFLFLSQAYAQDLESVLEAHYKAAGQEKMQKVETLITNGTNVYTTSGFKSGFKIYQSRPDMIRVEKDYQGAKDIQTFNGDTAWKYAPAMGITDPVIVNGEEKKLLLNQVQFENPLWNYTEKGAEIEILESGDDEGIYLQLTTAKGDLQLYRLDRESYLISSIKTKQMLRGTETEIELVLNAYKKLKGIPIAHQVITKMNGQAVSTLNIIKVEVNRKIDPALFQKPSN